MKSADRIHREIIEIDQIEKIEEVSADDSRSVTGSFGWGLAGAFVAGPLSALAAGFIGGKRNDVTFICTLKYDRSFVGVINARDLSAPFLLAKKDA
ncbi:hypothetical protein [Parasulfitobacter algicola]|uniref:Uncharacterized protein n=1 Tax=Parasulfitobacter algicola TaxID=2614809 RepID=A0ABX2IU22_9RHOB|nr:hypothetical protein [Sulfitobacter algicola]NSX55511.1 hypothetical protein [Sulfitobacter algicola]